MDECEWSLRRKVSCLSPFALAFRIADGLTLRRQQPGSLLILIRQREQHVQLRGVLGQTPITHHHVSHCRLTTRNGNSTIARSDAMTLFSSPCWKVSSLPRVVRCAVRSSIPASRANARSPLLPSPRSPKTSFSSPCS